MEKLIVNVAFNRNSFNALATNDIAYKLQLSIKEIHSLSTLTANFDHVIGVCCVTVL